MEPNPFELVAPPATLATTATIAPTVNDIATAQHTQYAFMPAAIPPRQKTSKFVQLRDLYGYLILINPKYVEKYTYTDQKTNKEETVDRLVANVIVLLGRDPNTGADIKQLAYGGNPGGRPPVQHDKVVNLPHQFDDVYLKSNNIICQCKDALTRVNHGGVGITAGWVTVDETATTPNKPWLLRNPSESEAARIEKFLTNKGIRIA